MLKIKDDVDLKELEKFGYEDCINRYTKKVMKDNTSKVWTYFETIEIDKEDRIIRTRLYQDCADQVWYGYIEKTGKWIGDLANADLVEKVK